MKKLLPHLFSIASYPLQYYQTDDLVFNLLFHLVSTEILSATSRVHATHNAEVIM